VPLRREIQYWAASNDKSKAALPVNGRKKLSRDHHEASRCELKLNQCCCKIGYDQDMSLCDGSKRLSLSH
jgi:hypothetical protein